VKNQYKVIPFRTITESLELYKSIHAPAPSFGMDLYNPDFVANKIVLLSNNGAGNKGVPIRCDHFIIVLCIKGESYRRINHHRFQITPNSCHVILPGQIHSFSNTSNDFEIYILLFEHSFLAQFNFAPLILDNLLRIDTDCNPKMNLNAQEFSTWMTAFEQINLELIQKKKYHNQLVANQIVNLLFLIKRKLFHNDLRIEKLTRRHEIFITFKSLIEQNFLEKKTVNEYAQLMHITSKHLSETIKTLTNHSALFHIHERIIHEAEYLLVYSNQSVKEISHALNFENPTLFGRFFKKHKSISPLKFRNLNK